MTKKSRIFLCTAFMMAVTLSFGFGQNGRAFAVTNVSVIPMDREGTIPGQTVIIEDGKIKSLGASGKVKIPRSATMIDGKGKFLIPGLFDMHTHFFYEQGKNRNTCEEELKVMLANGLTTVRIQCGDSVYLNTKENVRAGKWIGPEMFVSSPQFAGRWPWPGKIFAAVCATPREAEEAVRRFKKEGYDEIKITFMIKPEVYAAIVSTAAEVGMKVTGHVGPQVKLPAALGHKVQIEHMDEFIDVLLPDTTYNHGQSISDLNIGRKAAWETVPFLQDSRIPLLVRMVKEAGVYVTPTNYFMVSSFGYGMTDDEIRQRPDFGFIPPDIVTERWEVWRNHWKKGFPQESRNRFVELRKKMTYELWKGGVPLMCGSDSPERFLVQGFSLHDELKTFVDAGLTPFAALQTATVIPAQYLGIAQRTGSISVGKEADLILLDKNPLENIDNTRTIAGLFAGNSWFDRKELDKILSYAKSVLNR